MSGPIPKRESERRRRNTTTESGVSNAVERLEVSDEEMSVRPVDMPAADPKWHPIATMLYESLGASGQRVFYEPSDWAIAHLAAESISRDLKPQFVGNNPVTGEPMVEKIPLKGASLSAYTKLFASLMATEGDRRRMRLELERGATMPAETEAESNVVSIRAGLLG